MLLLTTVIRAQDAETQAIVMYGKAEQLYNENKYDEALTKLNQAEKLLDTTNTKILYLKANILNQLMTKNSSFESDFEKVLALFFTIVDKETYSKDKYIEMVGMDMDWKETKEKRRKAEQDFFNSIYNKPEITVEDLQSFNQTIPYASNSNKKLLSDKYQQQQKKLKEREEQRIAALAKAAAEEEKRKEEERIRIENEEKAAEKAKIEAEQEKIEEAIEWDKYHGPRNYFTYLGMGNFRITNPFPLGEDDSGNALKPSQGLSYHIELGDYFRRASGQYLGWGWANTLLYGANNIFKNNDTKLKHFQLTYLVGPMIGLKLSSRVVIDFNYQLGVDIGSIIKEQDDIVFIRSFSSQFRFLSKKKFSFVTGFKLGSSGKNGAYSIKGIEDPYDINTFILNIGLTTSF